MRQRLATDNQTGNKLLRDETVHLLQLCKTDPTTVEVVEGLVARCSGTWGEKGLW